MKIQFKVQEYQSVAAQSVIDCFEGQPKHEALNYQIDPGRSGESALDLYVTGFKNAEIALSDVQLLRNIQRVQRSGGLPPSESLQSFRTLDNRGKLVPVGKTYLKRSKAATPLHLDVEMETGTGKTYVYTDTIYQLHQRYGWSKFVIMVPSIAIREGIHKSLQMTSDHFMERYYQKIRFFIYDSDNLHEIESFSSDAGINVMIINIQAFNSTRKANRRIYQELDSFQSRRPIDVIAANRPILIIDEPQKIKGDATLKSLAEFNPLFIMRYSATHKTEHNKVHRLDAVDAYRQKLVKKIAVRGVQTLTHTAADAYLYLENIQISREAPRARMEVETRTKPGTIQRKGFVLKKGDNLYELSNELDAYREGYVITEIHAGTGTVEFLNGKSIGIGQAMGDVSEPDIRRIQIREAVRAHMAKERQLFDRGIKALALFFIDSVANYRDYSREDEKGDYARIFEEEYATERDRILQELPLDSVAYRDFLEASDPARVHSGYFSIDGKNRLVDPHTYKQGELAGLSEDQTAYDLIMKDKEALLSFNTPTRFIFSHSALREGWDNPNIFTLCMLKQSDNTISRRQEVGRGLRIAVNNLGERMDDKDIVHDINVLTVIASESYEDFVSNLQKEILENLSARPRKATVQFFKNKVLLVDDKEIVIADTMANAIYHYLVKQDYVDEQNHLTETYHEARLNNQRAPLPESLEEYEEPLFKLIDSLFIEAEIPTAENDRKRQTNRRNSNFHHKRFQELWAQLSHRCVYRVEIDSEKLIADCIDHLNTSEEMRLKGIQYKVVQGTQVDDEHYSAESLQTQMAFEQKISGHVERGELQEITPSSYVKYDLIGKISEATGLTRRSTAEILSRIHSEIFQSFKNNPELFIRRAAQLINEQKAHTVVAQITYNKLEGKLDSNAIFPAEASLSNIDKTVEAASKHVYDFVPYDSTVERKMANELLRSGHVQVFAKLPGGFKIPTPVGDYNPDWAIVFDEASITHIFFVAETKGSNRTLDLRGVEDAKIQCARVFFDRINANIIEHKIKYDVVETFDKLMELVGLGSA